MATILILQIDDATKFQQIVNLAKRLKIPFRFDTVSSSLPETDTIVWHWDDCDDAAYQLSLEAFAEDWNSDADKIWDNV